tara:strand:- start:240 stop:1256 length:1017 start_codon:yes stop_codon:yes gene_type:complete
MNCNDTEKRNGFTESCDILQLRAPFSSSELTKKYRIMALKFHPDKHNQCDAAEYSAKFQSINQAYLYLKYHTSDSVNHTNINPDNINQTEDYNSHHENINVVNFNDLLTSLISSIFKTKAVSIIAILKSIIHDYQNVSVHLFDKLDTEQIVEMFEFINSYHYILHIPPDIINDIKTILTEKINATRHTSSADRIVILNPNLLDLFNDNIYVLNYQNEKYYIPLWHSELHYQHNNDKLVIKCVPELPDNIQLDDDNNIHISINVSIVDTFIKGDICYRIGEKEFLIPSSNLTVQSMQTYIIKNQGISVIQSHDIYYNEKKSDIIFKIHFHSDRNDPTND